MKRNKFSAHRVTLKNKLIKNYTGLRNALKQLKKEHSLKYTTNNKQMNLWLDRLTDKGILRKITRNGRDGAYVLHLPNISNWPEEEQIKVLHEIGSKDPHSPEVD